MEQSIKNHLEVGQRYDLELIKGYRIVSTFISVAKLKLINFKL